jgi:phosphonopyruvate decarboxylase
MIPAGVAISCLRDSGVGFFTGVPDSLLSAFSAALQDVSAAEHLIAANEGAALALASGYHLATGRLPLVYLQNSGLGNLLNPLTSLVDESVYSIPVLLLIGWRGQPDTSDEPQHMRMGASTLPLLEALGVPVLVLRKEDAEGVALLKEAARAAMQRSGPVAVVVEKGVFSELSLPQQEEYPLSASTAIEMIGSHLPQDARVVCTTGKIGRSFYEWNSRQVKPVGAFLNIGAMGHAGSLAASLALHSNKSIWVLDGDGSLLMHMGALALVAALRLQNLTYVVLNNGAHESVGRQPTLGFAVDFCVIAKGCGFPETVRITKTEELSQWLQMDRSSGQFVEIRINTGVPAKLPRPSEPPQELGAAFIQSFQSGR